MFECINKSKVCSLFYFFINFIFSGLSVMKIAMVSIPYKMFGGFLLSKPIMEHKHLYLLTTDSRKFQFHLPDCSYVIALHFIFEVKRTKL